jgi:hypothetical protein
MRALFGKKSEKNALEKVTGIAGAAGCYENWV